MTSSVYAIARLQRARTVTRKGRRFHRYDVAIPGCRLAVKALTLRIETDARFGKRLPNNSVVSLEGSINLSSPPAAIDFTITPFGAAGLRPIFRGLRSSFTFTFTGAIKAVKSEGDEWSLAIVVETPTCAHPGWFVE